MPHIFKKIYRAGLFSRLWLVFLFSGLFIHAGSQDIYFDKSMLEENDRSSVEKLELKLKESQDDLKEANEINMELSQLETDYSLTPKELEKKSNKLETKANQLQFSALTTISETNSKIWKIYEKHAREQTNMNESQQLQLEQAKGYWEVAEIRNKDAGRAKSIEEKTAILSESIDNQNLALSTQMLALSSFVPGTYETETTPETEATQYEEPVYQPETTPTVTTASPVAAGVVIDESMITKYDDYVNDPTIPDPMMVNRSGVAGHEDFTIADVEEIWSGYQQGEETTSQTYSEVVEETVPEQTEPVITQETQQVVEEEFYDPIVVTEPETSFVTDEYIYRVQIAANTTELSQRTLQNIYSGNKKVEMLEEKGWYKYSIGDFDTFQEADHFRKSTGVHDAFIVRYRKGRDFVSVKEQPSTTTTSEVYTATGVETSEELIFNVQVAASKVPLSRVQIASIYSGDKTVSVIMEEGWYKYQIQGFKLYNDARSLRRNCGVNGAFVVAYSGGQKQVLSDAIQQNKTLQENANQYGRKGIGEFSYYVQLAASKVQLTEAVLEKLNPGSLPVRFVIEENWYKYQVPAGKTFGEAQKILQQVTVPGAFIVPYKQGKKQKLYQARQNTQ